MKKRLAELAFRRRRLQEKIEAQRLALAEISLHLQKPLALADAGLKAVGFIRKHPALVSGGIAALLSLRGMGVAGVAQKGWRLLFLYPSIISFGMKLLFPATRSSGAEELLNGHPEVRKSEVDN